MYDLDNLKAYASGQWLQIIYTLAPQLTQACQRFGKHVPCPTHGGKDGFRLFNDVEQTGGGICNTCGAFADGLDLLQWVNGWTFLEAVDSVAMFVGLDHDYTAPKRITPQPAPEKDWGPKRKWIEMLWNESTPNHPRLKQYLEYRGLSLDPPPSLRLHEGLKYLDDQKRNLGTFPCMIAQIIRDDDVVGLHVTFLDPIEQWKANVPFQKKIWKCADTVNGGSIRLFDTEPGKPLALTEGTETALTVRQMMDIPVWSCLNAGMLENADIPDSISGIIIAGDLDRNNRGQKAMERLAERLHAEGKRVQVALPPGPLPEGLKSLDWLDVMNKNLEVAHS